MRSIEESRSHEVLDQNRAASDRRLNLAHSRLFQQDNDDLQIHTNMVRQLQSQASAMDMPAPLTKPHAWDSEGCGEILRGATATWSLTFSNFFFVFVLSEGCYYTQNLPFFFLIWQRISGGLSSFTVRARVNTWAERFTSLPPSGILWALCSLQSKYEEQRAPTSQDPQSGLQDNETPKIMFSTSSLFLIFPVHTTAWEQHFWNSISETSHSGGGKCWWKSEGQGAFSMCVCLSLTAVL